MSFEDFDALAGNVPWRHAAIVNGVNCRPPSAGHRSRERGEVVVQNMVVDRGGGRGGACAVVVVVVWLCLGVVMNFSCVSEKERWRDI